MREDPRRVVDDESPVGLVVEPELTRHRRNELAEAGVAVSAVHELRFPGAHRQLPGEDRRRLRVLVPGRRLRGQAGQAAGPSPFGDDYERGWKFASGLGVDLVDEHSYEAPKRFFEHLDRFDD